MKLAKPILLSTAIAGILASPAAAALSATATTELNLRSGPGPEYQIEGVIPGDAEVEELHLPVVHDHDVPRLQVTAK